MPGGAGVDEDVAVLFPSYDGPGLPTIEFVNSRYQSTGGAEDFLDLYSVTPGQ